MTKLPLSIVRAGVFCLPLMLVTSCGSSTEAVQGTTINIDPAATGQATTLGTIGTGIQYYTVEARSPTGYAQIGVKVIIDSQYVVYDGHPTSLLGLTPLVLPYEALTTSNGTYDVTVLYDWGTAISGAFTALQAWSGTGYGNSNITFTCADPNTGDTLACP